MSWTNYLLYDFWTARKFNELDAERAQRRRSERRRRRERGAERAAIEQRLEELERSLEESALLLRSLADLCLEKGVLSPDDLAARAHELDGLDGRIDGRMGLPVLEPDEDEEN